MHWKENMMELLENVRLIEHCMSLGGGYEAQKKSNGDPDQATYKWAAGTIEAREEVSVQQWKDKREEF